MPRRAMLRSLSAVVCGAALAACIDDCAPVSPRRLAPGERQPGNVELGYVAPAITEFRLVPMGSTPIEETRGLADVLARRFPGLSFTVEPQQELPAGVVNEGGQVEAELLFSKLPRRPGTIAIVGRDLTAPDANFVYGSMDPATSNGIVSVSRFRSPGGLAVAEGAAVIDLERALAAVRLQNQVTSTVAKIFGMSFPCSERRCVLHFPRMMSEFDAKGGEFCPAHAAEYARILAASSHAPSK